MSDTDHSEEKIGDFMVRIGALTKEQVNEILEKQKQEPEKLFGIIAIEMGYLDVDAINRYIKEKEKG